VYNQYINITCFQTSLSAISVLVHISNISILNIRNLSILHFSNLSILCIYYALLFSLLCYAYFVNMHCNFLLICTRENYNACWQNKHSIKEKIAAHNRYREYWGCWNGGYWGCWNGGYVSFYILWISLLFVANLSIMYCIFLFFVWLISLLCVAYFL
jgi:hypothetical protein